MNNHTDVAKTTEISGVAFRQRGVCCASPTGLHHMAYNEWGDHDNPKVLVCVHGLTRNARDFDQLARVLAGNYRVICPEIVGRGRSDWHHPAVSRAD
jgi:pimeloyl-ACP methyl ester carboxylesterase